MPYGMHRALARAKAVTTGSQREVYNTVNTITLAARIAARIHGELPWQPHGRKVF